MSFLSLSSSRALSSYISNFSTMNEFEVEGSRLDPHMSSILDPFDELEFVSCDKANKFLDGEQGMLKDRKMTSFR